MRTGGTAHDTASSDNSAPDSAARRSAPLTPRTLSTRSGPTPAAVTRSPPSRVGSGAARTASSTAVNGAVRVSGAISGVPSAR